ncbi:MAG: hypothetical protein K2H49_01480 [Muribaculaceae bacterium]|nr:hypothetical protein [Muribaculaceae bacterium]
MTQNSPFYNAASIDKWTYPGSSLLESVASKTKVSKMRMFLVSEVPASDEDGLIPICCYIPYSGTSIGSTSVSTPGYLSVDKGIGDVSGMSGIIFNASHDGVEGYSGTASGQYVVIRLVYPLTQSELGDYKSGYLGYGSSACKLTVCHPDTGPWQPFTVSN